MNPAEFPLNSLNPFVALAEILALLIPSAVLGWMLSRLLMKRKTQYLGKLIEEKKSELAQLRISAHEDMDQPIATNASRVVYPAISANHDPDDLKIIEGIGPKIEEMLNRQGIHTYGQLAETPGFRLSGILKNAGPRFQMHDPSTWTRQAEMARDKKWDELEAFKKTLLVG